MPSISSSFTLEILEQIPFIFEPPPPVVPTIVPETPIIDVISEEEAKEPDIVVQRPVEPVIDVV